MAIEQIFKCSNCDFEFVDLETEFFYNEESFEVEEYVPLILTMRLSIGSKIRGFVKKSYCKHCDKFIKTFYINEVYYEDYNPEEIINILKFGLKKKLENITNSNKEDINYLYRIDYWNENYDEEKNWDINYNEKEYEKIKCPSCENEIYRFIKFYYPCPKCGGELIPGMIRFLD